MARPLAKDRDQKRTAILKAAAQTFAREGIARASMGQIAEACGISKANIYHYYASKNDLVFDILETYLRSLRDRVCAQPHAGQTPKDRLHSLIEHTLLAYDGMDAEHKIQTEGLALLPAQQQAQLRAYQRDLVAAFSATLCDLEPQVFAQNPQKLRATTMSIFGMLNWFYMWNTHRHVDSRKAYARLVLQLAVGGVRDLGTVAYEANGMNR